MRFFGFLFVFFLSTLAFAGGKKVREWPTIALVGPMSGPLEETGLEMRQAVQLYIDEINQAGGINGEKIKLLVYDDQGKLSKTKEIAEIISKKTNASVVISNFLLADSAGLSKIYTDLKLPMITASVAEEEDFKSPWLFSTLFDNHAQGAFIASYILKVLKYKSVGIIYSDDIYGKTLAEEFSLPYKALGGKIKNKWMVNPSKNFERDVIGITQDLLSSRSPPEVIFLATQASEAAEIVVQLKRRGLEHKIFGAQSLTDRAFIQILSEYPENKMELGYFSDGIMATSSLIYDVASKETQTFKNNFIERYKNSPSWVEAAYYDTAILAVNALINTKASDTDKNKREKVKDYLISLDSEENSVEGLNNQIFFGKQGDKIGNIMVGQFYKHKLISAYNQLDLVKDYKNIPNLDQQIEKGDILTINSQYLYKTDIIFTGIDFVEISDLDLKTSSYIMDFYVWFRYRGHFDVSNIEFINQVEPIALGEPLKKRVEDGVTYEAYRVESRFLGAFDFSKYPFDSQELIVQFRHKTANKEQAIYIRDDVGMRFELSSQLTEFLKSSKALESWTITDALFFKDFIVDTSGAADLDSPNANRNYEYSRFNAQISIERKSIKFVVKNLLPLFILMILIILVSFTDFTTRISVYVGAILAAVFEHIRTSNALPGIGYTTALDYIFYSVYFLIVIEITISIIAKNKELKNKPATEKIILNLNKIFIPFSVIGLITFFTLYYHVFSANRKVILATSEAPVKIDHRAKNTVLTLSSWRSEDQAALEKVLAIFNARNKNFSVIFEPIQDSRYKAIIRTLLENKLGPDLFYLDGNISSSKILIDDGYTLPLPDISTYVLATEEKDAWTKDGVLQAVPLQAVAQGIYFNEDIFRKLGLSIPKTWEEFLSLAKRIQQAGITPLANGTKDQWANAELIFMSLAPNFIGGKAGRLAYSTGERCFDDEHMVKLFEGIKDLGTFLPKNKEELSYYDGRQLFLDGKAAMWLSGSWELYFFKSINPDFSFSIFMLPAPKGKKTTPIFHFDAAIAINRETKNPEQAKEFIKWVGTPEFEKLWQDELPGFYAMNPHAPLPKDRKSRLFLQEVKRYETDVRWNLPPGLPSSYDLMADITESVLSQKMEPKEAANYLQKQLAIWYKPAQLCLLKRAK